MHTDSSASLTYFASASASECTTTVLMPMSRHARCIRSAISPRLAMRIFSNMDALATLRDHHQRLAVLDRLGVLDHDRLDDPVLVGFDFVHELHGLDHADRLAHLDRVAYLHKGLRARGAGTVEGANHRGFDDVPFQRRRSRGGRSSSRCGRDRRGRRREGLRGRNRHWNRRRGEDDDLLPGSSALHDLYLLLAFGDLQLSDPGILYEIDELFQLAQVHADLLERDVGRRLASTGFLHVPDKCVLPSVMRLGGSFSATRMRTAGMAASLPQMSEVVQDCPHFAIRHMHSNASLWS